MGTKIKIFMMSTILLYSYHTYSISNSTYSFICKISTFIHVKKSYNAAPNDHKKEKGHFNNFSSYDAIFICSSLPSCNTTQPFTITEIIHNQR